MADAKGRRGKGADAPAGDAIKTSIVVSRRLHSRWQAAASLTGKSANALAVEALKEAVKWVVIHDKRKSDDHVDDSDRRDGRSPVEDSADD